MRTDKESAGLEIATGVGEHGLGARIRVERVVVDELARSEIEAQRLVGDVVEDRLLAAVEAVELGLEDRRFAMMRLLVVARSLLLL